VRSRSGVRSWPQRLGRKFLHLFRGRHSPGRWSVVHFPNRTYQEQKSSRTMKQREPWKSRRGALITLQELGSGCRNLRIWPMF
jgi:hypothetical protein